MNGKRLGIPACAIYLFLVSLAPAPAQEGVPGASMVTTVRATILVSDPRSGAERLARWSEGQGGFFLVKSESGVVFRIPSARIGLVRPMLESVGDEIYDFTVESFDAGEELLSLQAGIDSRQEILERNLAFIDRADVSGTLLIEKEVTSLLAEIEGMKGRLRKLETDRTLSRIEISLDFKGQTIPGDVPSSFGWINGVDFYRFMDSDPARNYPSGGGIFWLSGGEPDGFASFDTRNTRSMVSPDGMAVRVRWVANEPRKDLEFWTRALESQLEKEGYRRSETPRDLADPMLPGYAAEWGVPYGTANHIYLTAIFVLRNKIVVAEAAAPYETYRRHRNALFDYLENMEVRYGLFARR